MFSKEELDCLSFRFNADKHCFTNKNIYSYALGGEEDDIIILNKLEVHLD